MKSNFIESLNCLFISEGGFSNRKSDPGGITNLGVTKLAWQDYVGHPVSETDMRNLRRCDAKPFYREEYWDKVKGDMLPPGIDYCVFDGAVHSGPSQSVKWLQRAVGCNDDGIIGPDTLNHVSYCAVIPTIEKICDLRYNFLRTLKNWESNKNGWPKRIVYVRRKSKEMTCEPQKD